MLSCYHVHSWEEHRESTLKERSKTLHFAPGSALLRHEDVWRRGQHLPQQPWNGKEGSLSRSQPVLSKALTNTCTAQEHVLDPRNAPLKVLPASDRHRNGAGSKVDVAPQRQPLQHPSKPWAVPTKLHKGQSRFACTRLHTIYLDLSEEGLEALNHFLSAETHACGRRPPPKTGAIWLYLVLPARSDPYA